MKKIEIYGASKPQDGRRLNEDAFLILRGDIPVVVVCDGAGNAEQSASKIIKNFQGLLQKVTREELMVFQNWRKWVSFLDANLMGGHQSTFTALAVLDDRIVGANIGDNRVYRFDTNGAVKIITQGSGKKRLGSGEAEPFPIHSAINNKEIISVMTDGTWGPLSIQRISNLYRQRLSIHPADLPDKFLQEAGKNGRGDDMTIVNIYY